MKIKIAALGLFCPVFLCPMLWAQSYTISSLVSGFTFPTGVAVDSNQNVYIADPNANKVFKYAAAGGGLTVFAGTGTAGNTGDTGLAINATLHNPYGVTVDSDGNVFIADEFNHSIREVFAANGIINTIAGSGTSGYSGDGGLAVDAKLSFPTSVALDSHGNLYICDQANSVIRLVTGGNISTVAGNNTMGYSGDNGPATSAQLNLPQSVAVDANGNLYIADTFNNVIRKVSAGIITTFAGNGTVGFAGEGAAATTAQLNDPMGVAVDQNGNVFITDSNNFRIRAVPPTGIIVTVAGTGTPLLSGNGGPAPNAGLGSSFGIAVGSNGNIYFADSTDTLIRELTPLACLTSVTPATLFLDPTAQTQNFSIVAPAACVWWPAQLPSWITSTSSGNTSGTLTLNIQANGGMADRTATVTVDGSPITLTQVFTNQVFNDVTISAPYFDAVNLLQADGVTVGCGSGDYCPTQTVTRDEMAVFIVRTLLGTDNFTYSATPYFTDVPVGYYYFKWIQKLYELGVTAGCAPGNYCPTDPVTLDEAAIFLIRARYGPFTAFTVNPTPYFADVNSGYYAFEWIQRMDQDGITSGCSSSPSMYCPTNTIDRGDVATLLVRAGFNQLLPPAQPVIASISPSTLSRGASATFTITGINTAFQQGVTTLVFAANSGITVNSITVTNATSMQVNLTAAPTAPAGRVTVYEQTEPEESVLPNGLTIQ